MAYSDMFSSEGLCYSADRSGHFAHAELDRVVEETWIRNLWMRRKCSSLQLNANMQRCRCINHETEELYLEILRQSPKFQHQYRPDDLPALELSDSKMCVRVPLRCCFLLFSQVKEGFDYAFCAIWFTCKYLYAPNARAPPIKMTA